LSRDRIENDLSIISDSGQAAEQIAYLIWGAVVSTTMAFGKVEIRIDPKTQRVFLAIELRRWARIKKMELFRRYWLAKADRKCSPFVPTGWKKLLYYKGV